MRSLQRLCVALTGTALVLATGAGPVSAQNAVQDPCGTSTGMPSGNCGSHWVSLWGENFNGDSVKLGSFSDCDHGAESPNENCYGLPKSYQGEFWAYPRGWYDTANPKNHSNGNTRTHGGEYRADDTTWVGPSSSGDGQMHIRMYRPSSGDNHVAAIVPKKCGFRSTGKYSERFRVSENNPGFKVAHLFYANSEIDYPEAGGSFAVDRNPEGFVHGIVEADYRSSVGWNGWHTYSIERVPGHIRFYLDGYRVKDVSATDSDRTNWVLQNESSLSGAYAKPGSSVQIDITWVKCWEYKP